MTDRELFVGAAMWNLKAWVGRDVPSPLAPGDELAAYARVVNAVEGNTTFYATPTPETARRWAESVPDSFRFMFKLPRQVTHERKLRGDIDDVSSFLRAVEPLHPAMDPVAIQLPASFGPDSITVLDTFLRSLPTEFRWAVEVRHPDFFDGGETEKQLNDLLATRGADRITLDSRAVFAGPRVTPAEHDAFENKPRLPVRAAATNDRPIVRFIGQTAADANPEFWQPWVTTCVRWIEQGRRPTVFIHTPDNAAALGLCRQFHAEVAERVEGLRKLPEPPPAKEPSLFDTN